MNFASLIVFCFCFFVFVFCLFFAFYVEGVIRFTKKGHILKIRSTLKRGIIYSCLWQDGWRLKSPRKSAWCCGETYLCSRESNDNGVCFSGEGWEVT